MAFCTRKRKRGDEGYTLVENAFIVHFLPYAEPNSVKVYLYGLKLCDELNGQENNPDTLAMSLNLSIDEVEQAYRFWEKMGLVEISPNPFSVRYLSAVDAFAPPKMYDKDKYSDFNAAMQELYPTRMLSANEFASLYEVIESYKVEPMSLLLIAKYCVDLKGEVSVRYIITVAENWFREGITTLPKIEQRIKEHEAYGGNIRAVFGAMGRKTLPDLEDREFYIKWTKSWGFSLESIIIVAKRVKSMKKLDYELDKLFRLAYFTVEEITTYYKQKSKLFTLASGIVKKLGLYYDSLDNVIETYVVPWQAKGYDGDTLITVAQYCFQTGIRTLEGMNGAINTFYKEGLITTQAINEQIDVLISEGLFIKRLLEITGSSRAVTKSDRASYNVWVRQWGFSDDMLIKAAELSVGVTYPISHINKILSGWKNLGITRPEEVSQQTQQKQTERPRKRDYKEREYTNEELQNVFRGFEEDDE